jgi:serine acetyltransferase/glycosyltransferase involved in cell wall biosynthesis
LTTLDVSVVIATYNRTEAVRRLVHELSAQTVARGRYEVIVVDDGSKEDARAALAGLEQRLDLQVIRQENAGAAVARQHGAEAARGRLLVFLDDDMRVEKDFVEAHLGEHPPDAHGQLPRRVVLGRLRAETKIESMPLFERFYARMLDRLAHEAAAGHELTGSQLYTGNVSLPRELFFAAGGFDPTLRLIEDVDLGVRLAKAGATFALSHRAASIHGSDHVSMERWLDRSRKDGVYTTRVARKHPGSADASPWRHLGKVNLLSRPVLALSVALPGVAGALGSIAIRTAQAADKLGLSRLAIHGTVLVYGIQYYRGVREETGGPADVIREYRAFRRGLRDLETGPAREGLLAMIRADHAALLASQEKYGGRAASGRRLAVDAVQNIGFQTMIGIRLMRALRDSPVPGVSLGAKFVSRMLRHAYGSDVHWDAEFAPGVVLVHGFGLAISPAAKVGPGCILFQGVTLGLGRDPDTGATGGPTLEAGVQIGVGSVIVGPITVGARTKVMANCTVVRSVPADSIVEAAVPNVRTRGGANGGR